ncbi:DNA-binding protein [Streptomyces sp. TRM64462]|uniref:DNA-binding protein n=1 Tax=Streptomyces sp. TRM64462 TaxID=2741726 RepID=UPI0015863803|nr:DNA-binding protein [Streptomyces sp. TRM64462]
MVIADETPSLPVVRRILKGLIDGSISPEEASDWAWPWITEREEEVTDRRLWEPLDKLSGAESRVDPETYLYSREDFAQWLSELPPDSEDSSTE